MTDLAIQKLKKEYQAAKGDKYGSVVKKPLLDVLCDFCRQDAEFAQAVYQGGSFEDALAAAVKGAQNHTPDIQIYRQAVQFYFPGSDIQLTMKINLCASAEDKEPETPERLTTDKPSISLDLSDFL